MHGETALAQRPKERRRDPRRRAAVDIALSLAELNASLGDYDRALEHLSAADQLTGGVLGPRFPPPRDKRLRHAPQTPPPPHAAAPPPPPAPGRRPPPPSGGTPAGERHAVQWPTGITFESSSRQPVGVRTARTTAS